MLFVKQNILIIRTSVRNTLEVFISKNIQKDVFILFRKHLLILSLLRRASLCSVDFNSHCSKNNNKRNVFRKVPWTKKCVWRHNVKTRTLILCSVVKDAIGEFMHTLSTRPAPPARSEQRRSSPLKVHTHQNRRDLSRRPKRVSYSPDHWPCWHHKRCEALWGAGLICVSRLHEDRYHLLHPPWTTNH